MFNLALLLHSGPIWMKLCLVYRQLPCNLVHLVRDAVSWEEIPVLSCRQGPRFSIRMIIWIFCSLVIMCISLVSTVIFPKSEMAMLSRCNHLLAHHHWLHHHHPYFHHCHLWNFNHQHDHNTLFIKRIILNFVLY